MRDKEGEKERKRERERERVTQKRRDEEITERDDMNRKAKNRVEGAIDMLI